MSALLIVLIATQVASLIIQGVWHYQATPAGIIRQEGPAFEARVREITAKRLVTVNDHKVTS